MRILVITDLYPISKDEIHTPKTIETFVKTWEKQGHEVRIIKPNFLLNTFLRKKPHYKDGMYGNIENLNYILPFMGDIKKKIKTLFAPDIVIAHMPCGLIFANKLGVNFVAAVHASDIEVLTNPIYKIYFKQELKKAYKNAQKIACRSYAIRQKFLTLYPQYLNKTFVAPSGINEDLIIQRQWSNNEKIKVLTCAQFIKRKNIDEVIRACEQFDNIELTIIGSGKEEKRLKKLSDKPIFTGQLPHNQVIELMKESDIFVLPSKNETFGMVYLEAMASGCITVCQKDEGIDGIIKHGENGFVCQNNLKNILEEIINTPDKNLVLKNSYETVLELTENTTAMNYLKNIIMN